MSIVYMLRKYFNCLNVYWALDTPEILEREATWESPTASCGPFEKNVGFTWTTHVLSQ